MSSEAFDQLGHIDNAHVLIVDAEVDLCLLMKAYFLRKGCMVSVATTAAKALSLLSEQAPDVILIDRGITLDVDSFLVQVKSLAPDAKVIIQNDLQNKELTEKEKEIARNMIDDEVPLRDRLITSNTVLTFIIVLIIILLALQLSITQE